jgi:hypothetical protein
LVVRKIELSSSERRLLVSCVVVLLLVVAAAALVVLAALLLANICALTSIIIVAPVAITTRTPDRWLLVNFPLGVLAMRLFSFSQNVTRFILAENNPVWVNQTYLCLKVTLSLP